MSVPASFQSKTNLNFTLDAAERVRVLIIEENNLALNLRFYIEGGGCSGFKYDCKLDETIYEDDIVVERQVSDGSMIRLLIDPLSYQYLKDSTIDFKHDIEGERFTINNPNAKTTCGCGSSFNISDEEN